MNDENVKKLKTLDKGIGEFLEKVGVPSDKIDKLTKKLKSNKEKNKSLNFADPDVDLIAKGLEAALNYKRMEERIIQAIKQIKIEPKITVNPPKVYVEPKEPKVNVEAPKVIVKPAKVVLQERPFPSEIVVKGFASFVKAIITVLRGQLNVKLGNVSKKTPLPVVLTHESKFYKAMLAVAGGGSYSQSGRLWIKNAKNQVVNPLSQQHTEVVTGTAYVITAGTAVQLADVDCKRVWVQNNEWNADAANCPNGGMVIIGDSLVTATPLAARRGKVIHPQMGDWFFVDNLNRLYIDALDDGAKIHYYVEK